MEQIMDWNKGLLLVEGFEWDDGNTVKNFRKHHVSCEEAEQIFFNRPLLLIDDAIHSTTEPRAKMFGKTNNDRPLTVSFTVRKKHIRIISARPMNKKERRIYEKQAQ
ncbi:MAG: BrnT family toxin [Deltaproteobacteria bacterium]|nr:BrnT family toxin [Deltaproteobacteria bacterium]